MFELSRFAVLPRKLLWVSMLVSLGTRRYVTEEDLELFKHRVEWDGAVPGAGPWEAMMTKDFGGLTYEAWRRTLPVCTGPAAALVSCFVAERMAGFLVG